MSVKLPPFWPHNTALWFAQAEAQFSLKGVVSQDTKYAHVVSMLDDRVASQVMDLIDTPPTSAAYETLKTRLTETFALTNREKAAKILDCSGLGDSSPTQVLNNLLLYVPKDEKPGFLFREVFLRQLPVDVQAHLHRPNTQEIVQRICGAWPLKLTNILDQTEPESQLLQTSLALRHLKSTLPVLEEIKAIKVTRISFVTITQDSLRKPQSVRSHAISSVVLALSRETDQPVEGNQTISE